MDDNMDTRKKYKKTPLEYEEIIHDEGYTFIWYVWDEGVYRKKYVKGHGRYREYVYSMETYERVKRGKYRHKYIRKKAVMPSMPKRTLKTRLLKKKGRRGKKTKTKEGAHLKIAGGIPSSSKKFSYLLTCNQYLVSW